MAKLLKLNTGCKKRGSTFLWKKPLGNCFKVSNKMNKILTVDLLSLLIFNTYIRPADYQGKNWCNRKKCKKFFKSKIMILKCCLWLHSLWCFIKYKLNFRITSRFHWKFKQINGKKSLLFPLPNPLSANLTKWSNTLKQFVGQQPTNCLSVFDHFVGLPLIIHSQ